MIDRLKAAFHTYSPFVLIICTTLLFLHVILFVLSTNSFSSVVIQFVSTFFIGFLLIGGSTFLWLKRSHIILFLQRKSSIQIAHVVSMVVFFVGLLVSVVFWVDFLETLELVNLFFPLSPSLYEALTRFINNLHYRLQIPIFAPIITLLAFIGVHYTKKLLRPLPPNQPKQLKVWRLMFGLLLGWVPLLCVLLFFRGTVDGGGMLALVSMFAALNVGVFWTVGWLIMRILRK